MANNKAAYGIAKGLGIDTEGMSPKEVWEAIAKKRGVSVEQAQDQADNSKSKDDGRKTSVKKLQILTKLSNDENKSEELDNLLGEEFKGYKGQNAVNKLLEEKHGHVKGAFHRGDIGDIDLIWGSDSIGLQHIINRREEQGIDSQEFLNNLSDVVEKGDFKKKNDRGNFEFWYNNKMVVIAPEYHGSKITFVLTAFKRSKKNYKAPQ